jgi:hypothetical protein
VADSGGALAVWLDGRNTVGHREGSPGPAPNMTLRVATVTSGGGLRGEAELDGRTCDCCPTAMVMTDHGPLVAYRDRSPAEVRDISVMRRDGGRWTAPTSVHADGWKIAGCPVNGPALDARGSRVVVAWYTAPRDTGQVNVAFSNDAGSTFGPPIRVDEDEPVGRAGVTLLDDGSAVVVWLEGEESPAHLRARRVRENGEPDDAVTVANIPAARSSGYPRVARIGDQLLFAWTDPGPPRQVRMSSMRLGH